MANKDRKHLIITHKMWDRLKLLCEKHREKTGFHTTMGEQLEMLFDEALRKTSRLNELEKKLASSELEQKARMYEGQ